MWITGIIFAVICHKSSDTGIFAVSMATTISGMGSLLAIYFLSTEFEGETQRIGALVRVGLVAIISIQLGCQLLTRSMRTYWDRLTPMLDTRISTGVAKGVITTKDNAEKYEEVFDDLNLLKAKSSPDDNVLIATLFPSAYLDLDMNYGTYSSWIYVRNRNNFEEFTRRLDIYYNNCSEKIPHCIYVGNENLEKIDLLDKVISLDKYESIEGKRGIIFVKE